MFYIKAEIAEGITIKAEITDENVFTTCPGCGTEHQVDLQDAFFHGELDLCGTAVYCAECSKHRAGEAPRSGERELHFEKWEPSEKDYRQLLTYFREYYPSLTERAGVSNQAGADLLVSLHTNATGEAGWNAAGAAGRLALATSGAG